MGPLIAETSRELPLVAVTVAFRVGAVHDPPERAGLARMAARMLRRGFAGMGVEQIDDRIDALGAELGAGVGLGSTTVHVEFLKRSLAGVTELLGQLLTTPSFDPEELGRLRRQTEAEIIEARDNDAFLASRALRRQLFAGHPHGVRVGGLLPTLSAIGRDDLIRFHAEHYTRANVLLGISGDLSASEVEALGAELLGKLPAGTPTRYAVPPPEPPSGRNVVWIDKPERSQAQMMIGTLGTHPADDDHVALLVANTVLGGTFTSRLVQEIRAKRGWSYGASSQLGVGRVRDSFAMWCAPSASDAAACLALQLDMLAAWRDEGVTSEELEFCQSYLKRSYAFEIDTAKKRVGQGLERALLELPADYHERFVERVAAVTREQAASAVRARIDPSRLWVSVVGTDAEIGAAVRARVTELGETVVLPHDHE
jgi:zinc protease